MKPLTLHDLLHRSLADIWHGRASEDTNAYNGATLLDILGSTRKAASVDNEAVLELVRELKSRGLSPATVNRHLSTLSVMLRLGQDLGAVKVLPRMRYQKEAEHRTRVLTFEEERQMFSQLPAPVEDMCIMLVETGLRLGEALNLKWSDLVGTDISVTQTKNGKPRMVPMTKAVRVNLSSLWHSTHTDGTSHSGGDHSPVFPQLTASKVHHAWNTAKLAAGFHNDPELVPHALRHTYASRLVMAGVDLVTVKTLLGHSNLQQTMRYAHMSPGQATGAAKALERLRGDQ